MKKMTLLFAALSLSLLLLAPVRAADAPAPGKQEAQTFEKELAVKLDYLLYLPADYQKDQDKQWPLIIFLHGSGERGSDVQKVTKHGPPKYLAAGTDLPVNQFIVVSPQCPQAHQGWRTYELNAMLDEIESKYHVDKDRIYLTGLSMGGYGTWAWAQENPGRFAAIAPMSGGGNPGPRAVGRIRNMPIWDFHGGADPTVPPEQSREMIEALKKIGNTEVKYTEYPGVGHDCWSQAYGSPELYEWFLQHKLSDRPAPARRGGAAGRGRAQN
jgi:predicted peptidase